MNEEEKKVIEIVQGLKVYYDDECLLDEEELEENKTVNNAIDTLINLVEKQQKELEQEKNKINTIKKLMSIGDVTDEALFTLVQTIIVELERLEGIEEQLEQEKEKNKDLEEKLKIAVAMLTKGTYPEKNECDNDFNKKFIAVGKIKEIVDECIEKKTNVITGKEEYCFNTNDNSFLAHKIVELLEEV